MSNFKIPTPAKAYDIDMAKIMKEKGAARLMSPETMKEFEFFINFYLLGLADLHECLIAI